MRNFLQHQHAFRRNPRRGGTTNLKFWSSCRPRQNRSHWCHSNPNFWYFRMSERFREFNRKREHDKQLWKLAVKWKSRRLYA